MTMEYFFISSVSFRTSLALKQLASHTLFSGSHNMCPVPFCLQKTSFKVVGFSLETCERNKQGYEGDFSPQQSSLGPKQENKTQLSQSFFPVVLLLAFYSQMLILCTGFRYNCNLLVLYLQKMFLELQQIHQNDFKSQ